MLAELGALAPADFVRVAFSVDVDVAKLQRMGRSQADLLDRVAREVYGSMLRWRLLRMLACGVQTFRRDARGELLNVEAVASAIRGWPWEGQLALASQLPDENSNVSKLSAMDADRALAFLGKHTRLGPNPDAETKAMGKTLLCYDLSTLHEVYERLTGSPAAAEETHEGLGQLIARTTMKPAGESWARFRRWSGPGETLSAELAALSDEDFASLYKAITGVVPKKRTPKTTEAAHKAILRGWTLS